MTHGPLCMLLLVFFIEIHEITRFSMVGKLCILFEKYDLMHHVIVFVKDESNNLMFMATTLRSTISYHPLKFQWFYEGMCFDHIKLICMLQMIRRYVIASLKHVIVKAAQGNLKKTIIWTKNLGKGKQECEKACVEKGLRL